MLPADGITVRQKSRALFQRYRPKADIGFQAFDQDQIAGRPARSIVNGEIFDEDQP
jgi:hypothetical protein